MPDTFLSFFASGTLRAEVFVDITEVVENLDDFVRDDDFDFDDDVDDMDDVDFVESDRDTFERASTSPGLDRASMGLDDAGPCSDMILEVRPSL